MMRLLIVGLLLVVPSLVGAGGAPQGQPVYLLRADADPIRFAVVQQPGAVSVQIYSQDSLSDYSIQVWLLHRDGTALPQQTGSQARRPTRMGAPRRVFSFEPVDPGSLAAFVFTLGGDFAWVHPMPQVDRETWRDDWVERHYRLRGQYGAPQIDELQDITLEEQGDSLLLNMLGPFALERIRGERTVPSPDSVQVWILRRDATALQRRGPISDMAATPKGGWTWQLRFERARFEDLIALIVRLDNRLFLYEVR